MPKPFGLVSTHASPAPKGPQPDPSRLEATDEWQILKGQIERTVHDLKEHLAHNCSSLEQMIAIQGQIRAYEVVLNIPEAWKDAS